MSVSSQPPTSEKPATSSGGGLYLIGALVLVAGAIALGWRKCSAPPAVAQQATSASATVTTATPEVPAPLYAPPPPPPIEDEPDAGLDAGKAAPKGTGGPAAAGGGPCGGGSCSGSATSALTSALTGRANSARGCYQRALRTSEVSGKMTLSVLVGSNGQVCSASIAADTVHSNEVASCVLGRFRGQSFPPPSGGCVTVNIPITFTAK